MWELLSTWGPWAGLVAFVAGGLWLLKLELDHWERLEREANDRQQRDGLRRERAFKLNRLTDWRD